MVKIQHCGPDKTTKEVEEAAALLHSIANGLSLKTEFRLTYDKNPMGSELRLVMIPPKVEVVDGVSVDSANKAAIDDPYATDSKKTRNANPKQLPS